VFIALTLSLLSAPEGAPPRSLGFVEVLQEIRGHSKILEQARAGVEIADGEVQKAWTSWQPNVQAIGSLTLNSVEATFDFNAILNGLAAGLNAEVQEILPGSTFNLQFPQSEPTVIQPYVQLAGVLSASQTLFNITVLRAPGVAKRARAAALAQVDAAEDQLFFQGATLFATIAGLKGLEAAAERAAKVAEQRIVEAKVQVEAGTSTNLVVTRAETDKVSAESQRIAVAAQMRKLKAGLGLLVGAEGPIDVKGDSTEMPALPAGQDYRSRTAIRAKQLSYEAADAAVGLSNLNWLPTLAAEGQMRWLNFGGFADNNFLATATLNLVVPIYDQGVRYADTRIAEGRARAAQLALEQQELEAISFLEEARADLDSAEAEVTQAEAQLKLANESVAQAETLVRNGLATNLDLSDADSRRYAADQNAAQKKLARNLALLRLHYASGGRLGELLEPR
jgi:outer membrane protein TolC